MSYVSDYYGVTVNEEVAEEALEFYIKWCKENNEIPEVNDVGMIDDDNITHILYHAEIQGFKII